MPAVTLTLTDGRTRWTVAVHGRATIDQAAGSVTLPDPEDPAEPIVLTDWLIVEFARERMHGLELLSEAPEPGEARQDAEPGS